jgi:NAD(P)H-dependent flavin oxidoreductase YrpB (nitropropane dioxygenase family)
MDTMGANLIHETPRLAEADFDSTILTTIATGRPLRMVSTPYIANWEKNRQDEIRDLTSRGILPIEHDLEKLAKAGALTEEIEDQSTVR